MRAFGILLAIGLVFLANGGQAVGLRADDNVPTSDYPSKLKNASQPLLDLGYIDVTKPPYNADPTGQVDSRAAIQRAANVAYANNLVTFVPKGTYLLSGAIRSIQTKMDQAKGTSQRKFARTLIGDNSGGTAPVLKLIDNATDLPENVFLYFAYEGADAPDSRHYASILRGFTIDMGNNPRATAVSMNAAQWSSIQDLKIIGKFDAGIDGLPGSGGSTTNVFIKGGKVGIRQTKYRPTPSIHGLTLKNQRRAGIELLTTRGALVVVGFDISGKGSDYQAISLVHNGNPSHPSGNLVLVDGQIEIGAGSQVAVKGRAQDIYLKNCYFKAPVLVQNGDGNDPNGLLDGNKKKWLHVEEYLLTSAKARSVAAAGGEIFANGEKTAKSWGPKPKPVSNPPFLLDVHRWDAANFPTIFQSPYIDVRDYGATPSKDSDDDSKAINKALRDSVKLGHVNYGKVVFLPRGHYHVEAPIEVPLHAKLIGASNTISVIDASTRWRPANPTALVRTEDGVGPVVIANLAISGHEPSAKAGITDHKRIVLFHGRSSNLLLRDVLIARREYWKNGRGHYNQPVVLFSGNAGGRVFNLGLDLWHGEAERMAASHRMLKIGGTHHPLRIYQPNVEGTGNGPQAEIKNSSNVYFYAFKFEGEHALLHIINSRNVEILGGSGNYRLKKGLDSIIDVVNSSDVVIANMARQGADADYAWLTNGDLKLDATRRNLALFTPDGPPSCSGPTATGLKKALKLEKGRPVYAQIPQPQWSVVRIRKLEAELRTLGCIDDTGSAGPSTKGTCGIAGAEPLEAELAATKLHPAFARDPQPDWVKVKIENINGKLRALGCGDAPGVTADGNACTIEGAASFEAELAEAKMHPAYSREPQPDWMLTKIKNLEDKLQNLGCLV